MLKSATSEHISTSQTTEQIEGQEAEYFEYLRILDPKIDFTKPQLYIGKFYVEHILASWDSYLKPAILDGLGFSVPIDANTETSIYNALLAGTLEAWAMFERQPGGQTEIKLVAAFQTTEDNISGTKALMVYSMYAVNMTKNSEWVKAMEFMRRYAKSLGYSKFYAYTENERILDIVRRVGGNTEIRMIEIEV